MHPIEVNFARRIGLVGVIVCAAMTAANGAEPKPDAALKNKILDASVFLDEKIKKDAALASDCLSDGKKWIAKVAADAAKSLKEDPQFFKEGRWTYERRYDVRSVVGDRYVSIVRSDYVDAHAPNTDVDTVLWDRSQNKRISIRPFFTETADNGPAMDAMLKAVVAALKVEKKKRDADDAAGVEFLQNLKPKLLGIGAVSLAPSTEAGKSSGLTFHYPPYAVGAYAEGEYVAFVPWEALKAFLTPEGARIFGGARPKSDEDATQP